VVSKALSGMGLPVALIFYDKRLDTWAPGAHTGTFRGNQAAFAAGTATIRIMRRDDVLDNVRRRGEQLEDRLSVLRDHPGVHEVRGLGLMWGVELAAPHGSPPANAFARAVQAHALRNGLIVELGGRDDSVVRLMPPLNVSAEVIDHASTVLLDAIGHCCPSG
jgi:diaminobutyrate-2-oxoglutarate transaminase